MNRYLSPLAALLAALTLLVALPARADTDPPPDDEETNIISVGLGTL